MPIRDATERDLEPIFAIYDREVAHGTATFETTPRSPAERLDWFHAHDRARYPILVATDDGPVIGWARLYPWSPRPAYNRTAENAVYVDASARVRGVGRALMSVLIERARAAGIKVIVARIAEGNPASLALHQAMGYERIGTMRRVGEKFGRILDVDLLNLHLD